MNKKSILMTAGGLVLGSLILGTTVANAYRGDPNVQGPNYTPERHTAMTQAFENNDYNAWKGQMQGKGRVLEVVNEGNFSRFAEMHQLMVEGKTDEASVIRAELGLGQGQRAGHGRNANR